MQGPSIAEVLTNGMLGIFLLIFSVFDDLSKQNKENLTCTSKSRILPCCVRIISTSFSKVTFKIIHYSDILLVFVFITSTWSLTLSPDLRSSLAMRQAVVTRRGRWVCSMLDWSWYLVSNRRSVSVPRLSISPCNSPLQLLVSRNFSSKRKLESF